MSLTKIMKIKITQTHKGSCNSTEDCSEYCCMASGSSFLIRACSEGRCSLSQGSSPHKLSLTRQTICFHRKHRQNSQFEDKLLLTSFFSFLTFFLAPRRPLLTLFHPSVLHLIIQSLLFSFSSRPVPVALTSLY